MRNDRSWPAPQLPPRHAADQPNPEPGPLPATDGPKRSVPLWMFVVVAVWAVAATGLFVTARSDRDPAVPAVPDLGALAEEHLAGLGVVEESGEDYLSATFYGVGLDELEGLLDELGFSPAVMNRIGNTRALDGTRQRRPRTSPPHGPTTPTTGSASCSSSAS